MRVSMIANRRLAVLAAVLGLSLTAGAAQAGLAQTTTDLNVRTGPGAGYDRIGALAPGTWVDVRFCQSSWCNIAYRGRSAWVARTYLADRPFVRQGYRGATRFFLFSRPGFVIGTDPRSRHRSVEDDGPQE